MRKNSECSCVFHTDHSVCLPRQRDPSSVCPAVQRDNFLFFLTSLAKPAEKNKLFAAVNKAK